MICSYKSYGPRHGFMLTGNQINLTFPQQIKLTAQRMTKYLREISREDPYKLCFVCLGNICRSPTAEGIFIHKVKEAGLEQYFY